jgi:pimeloyl-ACP methyl ester carboxylesterase
MPKPADTLRPFTIRIPDEDVQDLARRLEATRWPSPMDDADWTNGAAVSFIQRLSDHWLHHFDWRAQEARLNQLPHHMMTVDGEDIHFVYQRGKGPAPFPLIMTHGWPGSFIEMERILPLLTDPASHGGDPADAFDVIVPSLPGYGFSPAPKRQDTGSRRVAHLWLELMQGLGYETFGAQGGDIGAGVSAWLARLYPDQVAGIHLNYIPGSYRPGMDEASAPISITEQAYLDEAAAWSAKEGAYAALHGTKPQTLAFSLSDSPVGLAAWIVEKFRSWSDCGGDVESVFSMDALLTDISLYWFSGSVNASLHMYKSNRHDPLTFEPGERVIPALGMAHFPRELPTPPRSWVERVFDVQRWSTLEKGGHFAAMEQPEVLAEEIRAFFRALR